MPPDSHQPDIVARGQAAVDQAAPSSRTRRGVACRIPPSGSRTRPAAVELDVGDVRARREEQGEPRAQRGAGGAEPRSGVEGAHDAGPGGVSQPAAAPERPGRRRAVVDSVHQTFPLPARPAVVPAGRGGPSAAACRASTAAMSFHLSSHPASIAAWGTVCENRRRPVSRQPAWSSATSNSCLKWPQLSTGTRTRIARPAVSTAHSCRCYLTVREARRPGGRLVRQAERRRQRGGTRAGLLLDPHQPLTLARHALGVTQAADQACPLGPPQPGPLVQPRQVEAVGVVRAPAEADVPVGGGARDDGPGHRRSRP